MSFVQFEMERYQSTWEHDVRLNLSESGVHPASLGELMKLAGVEAGELEAVLLEYIQSNGNATLREQIAAFHPGSSADGIVVTSGSAEANFLSSWELAGRGDEIVFMEPNYFQIHGLADNFGAAVREWWLRPGANGWTADPERLAELVSDRTRAIVVTNPNNPTGARLDSGFIADVVRAAERVGAWVIADEVYRGAELDGTETETFWGKYDKVIVTGGLSKAYGLPGLRIGWAVTTPGMAAKLWARKDYTTISSGAINEYLATRVLTAELRSCLLERTRKILRSNWPILESWLQERKDCFQWQQPQAGAIAFVRYDLPIESLALAERLRLEVGCLLVPGAHFRLPEYLRMGFGPPAERLSRGLERLSVVIDPLRERVTRSAGA